MPNETFWGGLLNDKWGKLLLVAGAFLLLINIVVALFVGTKPIEWLFYFNMRYWSIYAPIFLWIVAIWAISESTDIVEDYVPFIRMATVLGILLVIIFALQSSGSAASPATAKTSIWFITFIVATAFCAVRSLFLLYDYRYNGAENIDMEEAQWFCGMSVFLLATLIIIGLAYVIPVKADSNDPTATESLFISCRNGLRWLIQNGHGSAGIRMLAFLIFVVSAVFVYVVSKWALIFLTRMRGE